MAGEPAHSSLTVRRLPAGVKHKLRIRAARQGRTLEAEARLILQTAAEEAETVGAEHLFDWMQRRFAGLGGDRLPIAPRRSGRQLPKFD